ncbi:MAG: 6-phosphogluconolactonase [Acidobacteriota bacterium]
MSEIIIAGDVADLNQLAAKKFVNIAGEAIDQNRHFTVALSGGSTPKAFLHLLASEPFRKQVNWENTLFFFGDERNVPPDHDESNFKMANEALFAPLGIRAENIYRWETELDDPEMIARGYESKLRKAFAAELPVFDLILLGMGADGHTASLFPGTPGLDETNRLAIANPVARLDTVRLTLTYTVINAAANVAFLAAGAEKAEMLARVIEGEADFHMLPARGVKPTFGHLYWFLDAGAAQRLSSS